MTTLRTRGLPPGDSLSAGFVGDPSDFDAGRRRPGENELDDHVGTREVSR